MENALKKVIEKKLECRDLADLDEQISEYIEKYPCDLDVLGMCAIKTYYQGNFEKARSLLLEIMEINEYILDINYNMAMVCEATKKYSAAFEFYLRSQFLNKDTKNHGMDHLIETKILDIRKQISSAEKDRIENKIRGIFTINNRDFPANIEESLFKCGRETYYTGKYNNYARNRDGIDTNHYLFNKVELFHTEYTNRFNVRCCDLGCIIPIGNRILENSLTATRQGEKIQLENRIIDSYLYYRCQDGDRLQAKSDVYIGKPIQLGHDEKRKKLVLNLFVEGLSQTIFEKEGMEHLAPNMYRYFTKGCICKNVYSVAEWALPSVPAIVTGKYTAHHGIYSLKLSQSLPVSDKILYELFQDAGYFTSKMDGNWYTAPGYGYIRGIDRTLYQVGTRAMRAAEVVGDIMESIEAFSETDQYIWACLFDLSTLCEELEEELYVQCKVDLLNREKRNRTSDSGVKNPCVTEKYKMAIRRLDYYLGLLFKYLDDKFEDEEIVVALFSDHGQEFLLPPNGSRLFDERIKVPFMIRGANIQSGVCDELMETTDIMPILCKSANVSLDLAKLDGNLPTYFDGEKKRKVAYSESISPGDPYGAVIRTDSHLCYFATKEKMGEDGRVKINDYIMRIFDQGNDKEIEDVTLQNYFFSIVEKHLSYRVIY